MINIVKVRSIENEEGEFHLSKVNIGTIKCMRSNNKPFDADISFEVCNDIYKYFVINNFRFEDPSDYEKFSPIYIDAEVNEFSPPGYLSEYEIYEHEGVTGANFINDKKLVKYIARWLRTNWEDKILNNELNVDNKFDIPTECPEYYKGLIEFM